MYVFIGNFCVWYYVYKKIIMQKLPLKQRLSRQITSDSCWSVRNQMFALLKNTLSGNFQKSGINTYT